jgi:hypothetical protein
MLGRDARVKVKIRRGVDVTTHRRALLLRAGAAAVLVTGALIGTAATPAFAAVTSNVTTGAFDINPGETKNISIALSNNDGNAETVTVKVGVNNGTLSVKGVEGNGVGGCDSGGASAECAAVVVPANGNKTVTFQVIAKNPGSVPAGTTQQAEATVTAPGLTGSGKVNINAKGPAATQAPANTVTEVSGTVNDSTTGKALKGATVTMEDGAGKSRSATTNDAGGYRFLGTEANPIAPGNISITVTMNGYDAGSKNVTGQAGKANTQVRIAIVPTGSTASPVPPPTTEESPPAGVDSQPAPGAADNTTNASSEGGSGLSSYILIALGALLVIFGIVAIVLLLRRRGDDDDEDPDEEPAPRRGPGGAAQRPGYRQAQADPTMVGAMGAGAPTMINRGAANDATAIVRPGRVSDYDVPPDPYGAPLPRAGSGYGAAGAGAGYGAANGGGYNDQAGYAQGAPSAGAGYGPSSRPAVDPYSPEYGAGGGYNDQAGGYGPAGAQSGGGGGYADSTQRWEPSAGNGYAGGQASGGGYGAGGPNGYGADPAPNGYGPGGNGGYNGNGANGYGADQAGYGPADQGGYGPAGQGGYAPGAGAQGGYGPAGQGDGYPSAGGYGPSAGNGYNAQGGDYDGPYAGRGGYEQRGGYEPAAGYERDGYERVPEPPRTGGNDNYEQRGGYGDPQGAPRAGGAAGTNRRSLDWLDD